MMLPPASSDGAIPSDVAADRGGIAPWVAMHADRILAAATFAAILLKFVLITRININWDEFYFLELVHQYLARELHTRFQTFHVHLFSWLPSLGWDTADQIVTARAVMATMATASAFLVYAIARRFVTRRCALFALLAYLSVSAVIEHGASFRVDPIVTCLSLVSLYAILCKPGGLQGAALAGAAMAVATLVTIKSAFYLPVIAALFWCVAPGLHGRAKFGLAFAASFSVVFGPLYLLHSASLAPQEAADAGGVLRGIASKMFFDSVFPRASDLLAMIIPNLLFWLMLTEGAFVAWAAARKAESRTGWLVYLPLVLALPVLTPLLYRNAFIYFYPFILAPAAVLVGLSFDKHSRPSARSGAVPANRLTTILILAQCAILLVAGATRLSEGILQQRHTIAGVRAVFPDPVPHIEGFGVLPAYPRSGFFMSSWGVENYRRAARPIFANLIAKDQPLFVLADSPSLYGALVPGIGVKKDRTLLPEDVRALQDNYVRHWGMLFVAGKHFTAKAGETISFSIAIGGAYRLEAGGPAVIDGSSTEPGGVMTLAPGDHTITLEAASGNATLRWAAASHVPQGAPTDPLAFFDRTQWGGMTTMMQQGDGDLAQ